MSKNNRGHFFEDFALAQVLRHATPRTVTSGDVALYTGLYGGRTAVQSSAAFAHAIGYRDTPIDDLITFHIVFGKSVPDISLNAVANLGYAEGRFLAPVFVGDTLASTSEVIGLKENANGETGVVYVRTTGTNQRDEIVLSYARWVMVRKRSKASPPPSALIPTLTDSVDPLMLGTAVPALPRNAWNHDLSGSPSLWADYSAGEKIDHADGMTVEEAEHQIATRLWQNTAKVHFDGYAAKDTRFGKRLIYGGVVISLARALSFNGLANAFHIAAINGGRHVAPLFAGDTIYAWSEILDTAPAASRDDIGFLRTRLVATKNLPCASFPFKTGDAYAEGVILDLDLWLAIPR
jgi:2-methylfumaryl-CoA hydratase